jgi:hypothetical protein
MINTNIAPIDKDLTVQKNTSKVYEVQITKNGSVVDITGWTIILMVKEKMADADFEAVINKTITVHSDPTQGKSLIRLETTDTDIIPKSYYYNIKFKDAQSPQNIGIIIRGRLTIEKIV